MSCTLKEAIGKRYYYENHQLLREHLYSSLDVYNFAK